MTHEKVDILMVAVDKKRVASLLEAWVPKKKFYRGEPLYYHN